MNAEISLYAMPDDDTPVEVETGILEADWRIVIGPLSLFLSESQTGRLYGALRSYFEMEKDRSTPSDLTQQRTRHSRSPENTTACTKGTTATGSTRARGGLR